MKKFIFCTALVFSLLFFVGCGKEDRGSIEVASYESLEFLTKHTREWMADYADYFYIRGYSLPFEMNPFLFIQVMVEENGQYLSFWEITDSIVEESQNSIKIYPRMDLQEKLFLSIQEVQPDLIVEEKAENPPYILCTLPEMNDALKGEFMDLINRCYDYLMNDVEELYRYYTKAIKQEASAEEIDKLLQNAASLYEETKNRFNLMKEELVGAIHSSSLRSSTRADAELSKILERVKNVFDMLEISFIYQMKCIPTKSSPLQFLGIVVRIDDKDEYLEDLVFIVDCMDDRTIRMFPIGRYTHPRLLEIIELAIKEARPLFSVDVVNKVIITSIPETLDKDRRDEYLTLVDERYKSVTSTMDYHLKKKGPDYLKQLGGTDEDIKSVMEKYKETLDRIKVVKKEKETEIEEFYEKHKK